MSGQSKKAGDGRRPGKHRFIPSHSTSNVDDCNHKRHGSWERCGRERAFGIRDQLVRVATAKSHIELDISKVTAPVKVRQALLCYPDHRASPCEKALRRSTMECKYCLCRGLVLKQYQVMRHRLTKAPAPDLLKLVFAIRTTCGTE